MKKILLCLILMLVLSVLCACEEKAAEAFFDGTAIEEYTIVYDAQSDYAERAAQYVQQQILSRTGHKLPVASDAEAASAHEIVLGDCERAISKALDADTEGVEFAMLSDGTHIAMEAEAFVIAAAAYYFVDSYVAQGDFSVDLPKTAEVHLPIAKEVKNFILLIGDGMGVYQTKLFDYLENDAEYSDGENFFYASLLPYLGYSRTDSLDGTTDSAAGGTALSSGYKTHNGYVGRDKDGRDLLSLTELAGSLGMGTAVMSTENEKGATPASFSAHADDRGDDADIRKSQTELVKQYGTLIHCGYDYYTERYMKMIEEEIADTLAKIDRGEGFFLMYEEAHIDKHSHNNDIQKTFLALIRFNQAIARFMEYAFYHPETAVVITADHETGDLRPEEDGTLAYHDDDHSSADVPVFAYGEGTECLNGVTVENVQIAMTIAKWMGKDDFGDRASYAPLN